MAGRARRDLDGRKFGDYVMHGAFLNEQKWENKELANPEPNRSGGLVVDGGVQEGGSS